MLSVVSGCPSPFESSGTNEHFHDSPSGESPLSHHLFEYVRRFLISSDVIRRVNAQLAEFLVSGISVWHAGGYYNVKDAVGDGENQAEIAGKLLNLHTSLIYTVIWTLVSGRHVSSDPQFGSQTALEFSRSVYPQGVYYRATGCSNSTTSELLRRRHVEHCGQIP